MAEQQRDTLYVIAAAYDDVDAAVADYETVKDLFGGLRTSHDLDAAVIAKDGDGTVRVVKEHEHPTRHGAGVGLNWGVASGIVEALFSPLGIVDAEGAGPPTAGVAGHVSGGRSPGDLKHLGEALDEGRVGLVALLRVEDGRSDRREHQGRQPHRLPGIRRGRRPAGAGDQDRDRSVTVDPATARGEPA
jgi:uncharacterized membrane protein